MILLINVSKERLHYYEFVKPIEDILKRVDKKYFIKNYFEITEGDLKKCSGVIICGTSLRDNEYLGHYHKFDWLLNYEKPVLGICAGMQIIGMIFGNSYRTFGKGIFREKLEIGFYKENFEKEFLGLKGEQEVYHLHNNYIKFGKEFEVISKNDEVIQTVKHRDKEIYGVLFHPEVRNKEIIVEFCRF